MPRVEVQDGSKDPDAKSTRDTRKKRAKSTSDKGGKEVAPLAGENGTHRLSFKFGISKGDQIERWRSLEFLHRTCGGKQGVVSLASTTKKKSGHDERFDSEDESIRDKVGREQGISDDADGVRRLFSFGPIAQGQDDLEGEEDQIWQDG